MQEIGALHSQPGMHKSLVEFHADDGSYVCPPFFTEFNIFPTGSVYGWKYEWLGWNMTRGGIVPQ